MLIFHHHSRPISKILSKRDSPTGARAEMYVMGGRSFTNTLEDYYAYLKVFNLTFTMLQ